MRCVDTGLGDEGAANHTRLGESHGAPSGIVVYGRVEFDPSAPSPKRYPARQTLEASQAVARLHGLDAKRTVYVQQNPDVIDQGVFHNDVIAVGNGNVLFYHEQAFADEEASLSQLHRAVAGTGAQLDALRVDTGQVPIQDAVTSYLFNSQLLTKEGGKMALVIPQECQENRAVSRYLEGLVASGGPIDDTDTFRPAPEHAQRRRARLPAFARGPDGNGSARHAPGRDHDGNAVPSAGAVGGKTLPRPSGAGRPGRSAAGAGSACGA